MSQYHVITNIEKDPNQWWPEAQQVIVRGSYEDAEKEANLRKYKSYTILKMKIENDRFVPEVVDVL